jgi:hypothetical protein
VRLGSCQRIGSLFGGGIVLHGSGLRSFLRRGVRGYLNRRNRLLRRLARSGKRSDRLSNGMRFLGNCVGLCLLTVLTIFCQDGNKIVRDRLLEL